MHDHVYFTHKLSKRNSSSIHCSGNTTNPKRWDRFSLPRKLGRIREGQGGHGQRCDEARGWGVRRGGGRHEGFLNPGAQGWILLKEDGEK